MAKSLSKKINAEITIERVYYLFFNKLIAKNFTVLYPDRDTLLNIGKLSLNFVPNSLLEGDIKLRELNIDGGVFNLTSIEDSTTNIAGFIKLLSTGEKKEIEKEEQVNNSTQLSLRRLKMKDFRFNMKIEPIDTVDIEPKVINFTDLSISNIDIDLRRVVLKDDTLRASLRSLTFHEKSGFNIKKFNGEVTICPNRVKIEDLSINDGNSSINAASFSLNFRDIDDFSDFLEKVDLKGDFFDTYLDFSTISYFTSGLSSNKLSLYIDGKIGGTISDLKADSIKLASKTRITNALINAHIKGLPESETTILTIDVIKSSTTAEDLSRIISSLDNSAPIKFLKELTPGVEYSFTGNMTGLFNDFLVKGNVTSGLGDLKTQLRVFNNSDTEDLELTAVLNSNELNIGTIANEPLLGKINMSTGLKAILKGPKKGNDELRIDSLFIRDVDFNDYTYKNIAATGSYLNNIFDGKVICRDQNLDFIFQGIIGGGKRGLSYYDFYVDIIYANLFALNLDKRDSLSRISFKTLANFSRNNNREIEGTINIKGLNFKNSNGTFPIGDISVQSTTGDEKFNAYFRSSFANATYRGDDFITNFVDKILDITLFTNLNALFYRNKEEKTAKNGKRYLFNIEFSDTKAITQMLLPGLNVAAGTTIRAEIDEKDNFLLDLKSKKVGYGNIYSENMLLNISGNYNGVNSTLKSDVTHLSGIELQGNLLNVNLKENSLKINSEYANKGILENKFNFASEILFTPYGEHRDFITDISIDSAEIYLNGELWRFNKSKIVKQDSTFVFHDFLLSSKDQYLSIDGIISTNPFDTLSVQLKDLNISSLNSILPEDFKLNGIFSGNAILLNLYDSPQIFINTKGKNVIFNDMLLGELNIISDWEEEKKQFRFNLENFKEGDSVILSQGYYTPSNNHLHADIELNNLSISFLQPFFEEIISDIGGGINGKVVLDGPMEKIKIRGSNTTMNNLSFKVDYTNVYYTLNGPFTFREDGIVFDNILIRDKLGNRGRVTGGVKYLYFDDFDLNILINFTNMEALNTREEDNTDFYGTAFATGRLSITGLLDEIYIDASVNANKNTAIHIPLSSSGDVSTKNLLTFIKPQEVIKPDIVTPEEKKSQPTELIVKLRANMTPDAAMLIEIDKSVGDVITGYGNGLITIDINPLRDIFSITGDYIIQSGSYKFVLQGFIERDFTVQEGGNISFNGDIMKTNLNLTANYRTKASINPLISDAESISNKRNIDCQIIMNGPLMNPNLNFSIDIPDLNPITKERVSAALNTEDKVVKQVMSLLVSGSFIPDMQSNIVNNSTLLYSNATDVLSNQINKIFNQLDIPLDLSFNYQPGQNGRDLFDAAVSAQLFNNRVIVNGNIGSSKFLNSSSEIVGDLDVEVKLDDKGRFRAKAFSHSADQYSNYLDNTQRNGIGLVYQEEFDTFKDLIKSLFVRNKRKEQLSRRRNNTN